MTSIPKVSIVCATYNQQKYISQAIDSFLMQECNFDFEIIIHDDCSTDGTSQIIRDYEKKYPQLIKPIYQEENIYSQGKKPWVFCLKKAKGNYIALSDGDDYWTDPLKLQKQVDFLDVNEDFNICFHRANLLRNSNDLSLHPIPDISSNGEYIYKDLLEYYNFITTASVVTRKPDIIKFSTWFNKLPFGDMGLYLICAEGKKIKCLDDVMSVYRIHNEGLWSKLDKFKEKENYLSFYKIVSPYLNDPEKIIVRIKIKEVLSSLAKMRYPTSPILKRLYYLHRRFNIK
ncbi:glycosyltransferase [Dokdonia sinensis]|uniref:Glycosyltransferase n=1 Tax=Dokdonia sinensis TaxID=2479847 RepID=A0A3M0FY44_9FLAO|nr:glycosyltransferase [Dokdonia sinensis]RMB57435.1 glycosyltransferase [Dokdonia sinensis]